MGIPCIPSIPRPLTGSDVGYIWDTRLAAPDVHPRVAMQILRHSQISVTMEIYTEATSESTRAALTKLGDSLGRDEHGPWPLPALETKGRYVINLP